MLKLAKLILLLLIGLTANTQTHHFIFIENLAKKPFSIKLENTIFESGAKNFITIPKLENGTYNLLVSTDDSKDNKFTIEIDGSDLGFTLKKNSEGDWVLFDINRFTTTEQIKMVEPEKQVVKQDEPIVKQANIETPKPEIKAPPVIPIAEPAKQLKTDSDEKPVAVKKPVEKKEITKLYEKENKEGLDQIYVDMSSGKADTIAIFIPYPKTTVSVDTIKQAKAEPAVEQKMENKNIDVATPVIIVNNCPNKASESEVANFSAQIQATLTLKNKLKLANTVLKDKCFTVNQVKRLGVLFLNESGKFNFYKLAQTAVSDSKNFGSLEKELTDAKLKEEFKLLSNPQ